MSTDRTDPRWEEYLSTGTDPCKNDIVDEPIPRVHRKRNNRKRDSKGIIIFDAIIFFLFAVLSIYALFFSPSAVEERRQKKEIERQEAIKREEMHKRIQAVLESSRTYSPSAISTDTMTLSEPTAAKAEPIYKSTLTAPRTPAQVTAKKSTPYQQGYWDGYDEGYDDRIQGMGFGYKYDCDGESYEYQDGYAIGYREGFREAWEDEDAFGSDEW